MRKVLLLALIIAAILPIVGSRPAAGCTDWDQDGVCAYFDCDDNNPEIGYDGDYDGDGVTICEGDADDTDLYNINRLSALLSAMYTYPMYYHYPEQCTQGFTITTKLYECSIINGYRSCLSFPYYQYDTSYLKTCFP